MSDVLGRFDCFKSSSIAAYLSNTLTNLQFCIYGFLKFLIVLFHSLLLCFCTVL